MRMANENDVTENLQSHNNVDTMIAELWVDITQSILFGHLPYYLLMQVVLDRMILMLSTKKLL